MHAHDALLIVALAGGFLSGATFSAWRLRPTRHRHAFRVAGVQQFQGRGKNSHGTWVDLMFQTRILLACSCTETRVEVREGHWTKEQVEGGPLWSELNP